MSNDQTEEEEEKEEEENLMAAFHLCRSFVLSMVIKATIELGVFDMLDAEAKLTADEIAGKLQVSRSTRATSMLDIMLGLLATNSLLTCSSAPGEDGRPWKRYGLTPVSRFMARRRDGVSLAPLFLLSHHKERFDSWHYLKEAVQDEVTPFKRAYGETMFEHLAKNSSLSNLFNEAMENQSNLVTQNIIKKYKDGLMQINVLVDVGGGTGATLSNIISKYPHIKGINFDLPQVISLAPSIQGVEHIGGDMLDVIPRGGAILLKWILHNWDDEHCLEILKNCWRALPISGKLIIVEYILPEFPETNVASREVYATGLIMMTSFDGAKERTEKELRSLAKEACFSEFKVFGKFLNYHIIELIK